MSSLNLTQRCVTIDLPVSSFLSVTGRVFLSVHFFLLFFNFSKFGSEGINCILTFVVLFAVTTSLFLLCALFRFSIKTS
jgi:hypothetical protein